MFTVQKISIEFFSVQKILQNHSIFGLLKQVPFLKDLTLLEYLLMYAGIRNSIYVR